MSYIALHSASSALTALNTALDVTANNLANVNTAGFKASRANFQDLLYLQKKQPGSQNASSDQNPTGLFVGLGTRIAGTQLDFSEGSAIPTDRPLDIIIKGRGFFRVQVPTDISSSGFAYTRDGQFTLNADGEIVMATDPGRRLDVGFQIPPDAETVAISADGVVSVNIRGEAEPQELGILEISDFINPTGLEQAGDNLFLETGASGSPVIGQPGTEQFGELLQGMYENSNVDPTRELIDLIRTQRAFEMNSQTIRAADEALRTVSQLRR